VRLSSGDCTFTYERIRPGALLVTITGFDKGQFGTAALDEIHAAVTREGELELFIDGYEVKGTTVAVSDDWTRFFSSNRTGLTRVHVLVGSKVVQLTVAIAQHLSRTGNLIQIYSDPETFKARLDRFG
jgi:hypothetical protein